MGHFATGVAIVSAVRGDSVHATTVNALTSVTTEPPTVIVCLNEASETGAAVAASRRFVINLLRDDQREIAVDCAAKGPGKLAESLAPISGGGVPALNEALAHLECDVVEVTTAGTHRIFIAEVATARSYDGSPLTFFRGRLGGLDESTASP
jgi:flavin reductase (DIM6/NTAB) family NADH-FMN oxidoreductase RutF